MEKFAVTDVLAKINLALNVTPDMPEERRLHSLKSVVVPFPALKDRVTVRAREDGVIGVTYSDGRVYPNDKVIAAATMLKELYGTGGADIYVERGIPEGVGIGSSSAAVAGVAKCFKELYGIPLENKVLVKLGSDVPVQVYGGAALVGGDGGEITPLALPELYLTLVYGEARASTEKVFALYDVIGGAGGEVERFKEELKPFNALETAAISLNPDIIAGRKLLYAAGFERITMTGSGSGYAGMSLDKKENAELYGKAVALGDKYNLKIFNSVIIN